LGDLNETGHLEVLGVDGKIILKRIFNTWDGGGLFGSGHGEVVSCCESGNEPSGFIKCGEFLD